MIGVKGVYVLLPSRDGWSIWRIVYVSYYVVFYGTFDVVQCLKFLIVRKVQEGYPYLDYSGWSDPR